MRFASIAVFDVHYHRHVYADARLVLGEDGSLKGVLPKGKRTIGRALNGGEQVYAKAATS